MTLPHKSNANRQAYTLNGYKALIITTSQSSLDKIDKETGKVLKVGKATGVYASEMTEPYYTFLDAQMEVDIASIAGGQIPIEKLSLMPIVRTKEDTRFLSDPVLKDKVNNSKPIAEIDINEYDIVFLSGGWGAAYDFAQSSTLSSLMSEAYATKTIMGAVCHGPLGLIGATKPDGSALVENVKMTGVTNKQLRQLMVGDTPKHPETELRKANAKYEHNSGLIDMFKSHIVVDKEHLIVTGQNQKGGVEAAQSALQLLEEKTIRQL
jgi:putative intracellular protease/amidase